MSGRTAVVVGTSPAATAVARTLAHEFTRVVTAPAVGALTDTQDAPDAADAFVYVADDPDAYVPRPLAATDEETWDRLAEAPVREGITALQAAHPLLAPRGGTFVLVSSAVAIDGADGLVPMATASEALRALAKSAARRWAREGITVNLVASAPPALDPDAAEPLAGTDADRGDVVLAAGSRTPQATADTVALLLSPGARHLTGATLAVDGGALMAP